MASFLSSVASMAWSPTWLLRRLLTPQLIFPSSAALVCASPAGLGVLGGKHPPSPNSASDDSCPVRTTRDGTTFSQRELVALDHIFNHFDENKDGKICRDELRRSLHMLGIEADDEELTAMIDAADWNSDGCLDFSEFAAFYYSLNEEMGQKLDPRSRSDNTAKANEERDDENNGSCDADDTELSDAFKLFDKNGDGYICAEELQSVLGRMGLPQGKRLVDCRDMIRAVDVDGDGQVSFAEFKTMMVAGFGPS